MEGVQSETVVKQRFRSPARILIPKLVQGRDKWKVKADDRKRRLKAAQIRIRDLETSRTSWRERAEKAEERVAEMERELAASQAKATALHDESAALRNELKKRRWQRRNSVRRCGAERSL